MKKHKALVNQISHWPSVPGVYVMRDLSGRILYVGKAKNLKNRIRSYFSSPQRLAPKTRVLVNKIAQVEFTVTQSELEALLLECNLIKKHRPRYNVRLKDDKNYPCFALDFSHPFPQFRVTRRMSLGPNTRYFGPFNAGAKEIGRFLLKTFQIRDCSDSKFKNRSRPCINFEIGICTAPCVGYVDKAHYIRQVQEAVLFLKGRHRELLRGLRLEMKEQSKNMEYERARVARDKILAIKKLQQKQQAVLATPLNIDVVACEHNESEIQWVALFLRAGLLTGRRAERGRWLLETPAEATRSFLEQYYSFALIPDEVWLSHEIPERNTLEEYLCHKAQRPVKVLVKRNERALRLLNMARENARLLLNDRCSPRVHSMTEALGGVLGLDEPPDTIEGFDVSNLQGEAPVISLVHFAGERPLKSRYRIFHPRSVEGQNDFAMISEAITRHYSKASKASLPNVILIDGGKGQLNAAVAALKRLEIDIPIVALAKGRARPAFTRKEVYHSDERVFVPNRKNPLLLREGHLALRLLQQVRDEAHRFAIFHHRKRRAKERLDSELLEIPGIAEKRSAQLLRHFGGVAAIRSATEQQLAEAGLNRREIASVLSFYQTI